MITLENTLENNRLIAAFMGIAITPIGLRRNVMVKSYYDDELKYHMSWDWLMPVVDKIESIKPDGANWIYCVTIEREYCVISENGESPIVEKSYEEGEKMQAVYDAIVEFINRYNKQD